MVSIRLPGRKQGVSLCRKGAAAAARAWRRAASQIGRRWNACWRNCSTTVLETAGNTVAQALLPAGSRLRTPDLAQGFWAAEENDLTRIYRSGWLLRAALKEKLGPCRSFSCRSFRRV